MRLKGGYYCNSSRVQSWSRLFSFSDIFTNRNNALVSLPAVQVQWKAGVSYRKKKKSVILGVDMITKKERCKKSRKSGTGLLQISTVTAPQMETAEDRTIWLHFPNAGWLSCVYAIQPWMYLEEFPAGTNICVPVQYTSKASFGRLRTLRVSQAHKTFI